MRTLLLLFVTACLATASAANTYKLALFYPSFVGESQLNPGNCKVTLDGDKVVLKQGRKKVEATVQVETVDQKFKSTSVRYTEKDGKRQVSEIRLGGTTTKLVFD